MKKIIVSLFVLAFMFVLASCGSVQTTAIPQQPTATKTVHTQTKQPAAPPVVQPTMQAVPLVVQPNVSPLAPQHLKVGQGVQLVHFYVTVTRAELKTVQTPPPGMTYLLVTVTLHNTTNVDRPLYPANYILHSSSGKAFVAHLYNNTPAPPYGNVHPKATMLGVLIYEIPLAQTHYTFTYQWTLGAPQASWDIVTF